MATDVFLSYATDDKATADRLIQHLEHQGVSCWVAHRDSKAGAEWASSIVDAIEACQLVVLVYSAHSNKSQQVLREMERAVQSNIPILPVLVKDEPLSKSMRYFLGATHWLDVSAKEPYEQNDLVLDTVKRVLETKETVLLPSRVVLPAPAPLKLLYWVCLLLSPVAILFGLDGADGWFVAAIGTFALSFGLYGLIWGRSSWRTSVFVGFLLGLGLFFVLTVVVPLM